MFIDTLRPESTSGRICEAAFPVGLTNSAGRGARIYEHANRYFAKCWSGFVKSQSEFPLKESAQAR